MRSKEPLMHRHMRIFVNRANRGRELLSTFVFPAAIKTRTSGLADNGIGGVNDAAVWTDWAIRPADSFEMLPSGGFIVKDWISKIDRHFRAPKLPVMSHSQALPKNQ